MSSWTPSGGGEGTGGSIKGFFTLLALAEARAVCKEAFEELKTATEIVTLSEALDRVLAADLQSLDPVPHFSRSTVDGYALHAVDTAGATAGLPSYLEVVGEVIMGRPAGFEIRPGQVAVVPTGGMLPAGADAAVMIEHTERLGPSTIEVGRAVAPGSNVIMAGEDVAVGEVCLHAGVRLGPGAIALLATLGVKEIEVHRRPVVALLSTGDEVVPATAIPGPAEVRDANAAGLAAMILRAGGIPHPGGIVKDVLGSLEDAAKEALGDADALIISGGSSVGERDHAAAVLGELGAPGLLFHGVAIKPGKPTIAARAGAKPVFGLPGHPLSAMISFQMLLRPVLRRLGGERKVEEPSTTARLSRRVSSDAGRTELVRVALHRRRSGQVDAEPLFGKSAALSSLITAHGLVEVPLGVEGIEAGEFVEVQLF